MKKVYIFIFTLLFIAESFAQAPQKINLQAIIRTGGNTILANTQVRMRISILQGSASGTSVYTETQTPTTNGSGLVNIEIGGGAGFSAINWNTSTYFIKTETDPTGGTNYTLSGTSQFQSLPYALNAKSLGATGTNGQILSYKNNNWVATDITTTTSVSGSASPTSISNIRPYLALNYQIALEGIYPSRNDGSPFIGEIMLSGFNYETRGFAFCNGQLLAISENDALFSLIGTTFGGDGQSTFGLPDLRGRVAIHNGQGAGLSNYQLGEMSGAENFVLTNSQLPAHNHTLTTTQD